MTSHPLDLSYRCLGDKYMDIAWQILHWSAVTPHDVVALFYLTVAHRPITIVGHHEGSPITSWLMELSVHK
jgi:hypothetical protein